MSMSAAVLSRRPSLSTARRLLVVEFTLVHEWLRIIRSGWLLRAGRYPPRRTQNHQLRVALLCALALEEVAQDWNVSESRDLINDISDTIVHQSGDDETLSILQLELGIGTPRTESWNGKAGNGERVGEVKCADFRNHAQMDIAVGLNKRSEVELHSKIFERNSDCRETRTRLHDGEGKLSTGQETCFFAIDRDQRWFG